MLQAYRSAGVIAMPNHLGLEDCSCLLSPTDGTHQIYNLLSLQHDLRLRFGRLDLWFEGTNTVCYPKVLH